MAKPRDKKKQGKAEEEEFFELIIDKRHKFHGNILTINKNLGRIVVSSQLYAFTKEKYGKEVTHVQLLMISSGEPIFLIVPCEKDKPGARGVHVASGSRVVSAKLLLQRLEALQGFTLKTSGHYSAEWEEKGVYRALRVDMRYPMELEG